MHDDREEFEKDLNADEASLDQEAWALDEASEDQGRRFTAAMERLDAEVAAHEAKPIDSHPPQALRFGERLRAVIRHHRAQLTAPEAWTLEPIADAIDRDAEAARLLLEMGQEIAQGRQDAVDACRQDLRHRVEEAVERLAPAALGQEQLFAGIKRTLKSELARIFGERAESPARPRVVCLCGSTRFKDAFDEANYQETMAGRIVLSVGFFMHASGNRHGQDVGATPEQKARLDELHLRKIDMADEVLVLNVGGYIGESTSREIAYALAAGRPVRYLEVRYLEPLINPEHEPASGRRHAAEKPEKSQDGPCPKCGSLEGYSVYVADGDYEDEHHRCEACGREWWVEGADA